MRKKIFFVLLFVALLSKGGQAQKWKEYKQQYFIVYYKNAPIDFVKAVEEAAEDYYRVISKNLGFRRYKGWTWDDRAKIYIYDDRQDYVETARAAQWSHGITSPRDKVIRTFPAAHGFFDSTLPHELGHIIFREFVGFRARVPAWFEEGVAMSQEKAKRWGAHKIVKRAMEEGRFIPLDELTHMTLYPGTSQQDVDLFYIEAASAVQFLITQYGQQRFVRLCRKLREGNPFEWTLAEVYVRFKTMKDLNKAWVKFLKDQ